MSTRFMTFVDGSNLYGTLRKLGIKVQDFEAFYRKIFESAAERWSSTWYRGTDVAARQVRIYWYVVAWMDEWDFQNPSTREHLRDRFFNDRDLRRFWMAETARRITPGTRVEAGQVEMDAFNLWLQEYRSWYDGKRRTLDGMLRFYHGVESSSEFIEFRRCGRWKVGVDRTLSEKRVDTALAVDMVGMKDAYDVAVLVCDDADAIPSLQYLKDDGKHVAVVDFQRGHSPESRGRGASRVKMVADFLVPIYEMDLIELGIASRAERIEAGEDDNA